MNSFATTPMARKATRWKKSSNFMALPLALSLPLLDNQKNQTLVDAFMGLVPCTIPNLLVYADPAFLVISASPAMVSVLCTLPAAAVLTENV
jgi:hypothetical protein